MPDNNKNAFNENKDDPNDKSRYRSNQGFVKNAFHYIGSFFQKNTSSHSPVSNNSETISAWNIVASLSAIVLAKENRPRIIAASVLTSISSALNFVTPYLMGETINALAKKENVSIAGAELTPVTLILMLIAANTLSQIMPNLRDQVLAPIEVNDRRKIFTMITDHQLNKSLDYHSKTPLEDQLYLIEKGYAVSATVSPILTQIAPAMFEIIMAVAVLSNRFGGGMGVGIGVTAALYTGYSRLTTQSIIDTRQVMLSAGSKSIDKITSAIKQYKNIHDFGKHSHEMKAVEEALAETVKAEINMITAPLKIGLGQIAIPRFGMLAAALYVGVGVQSQQFSVQEFILLINYLEKLSTFVPSVGKAMNGLFATYPDLKFVFGELGKSSEIIDAYPDIPLKIKQKSPSIRFENVTFRYPKKADEPEKPPLLNNLSFTIESGQSAAFVSKSGGGKSTIFKLLYRYNIPSEGNIYIDGQDISKVSLASLQSNIALIAQNPNLFNASIRDNIRYGAKYPDSISDEKIWNLAKIANLSEFLNSFEEKLDRPAGEEGKQLSGGEQQRVAILRGLLKESPIRLFDEITSALDSNTATQVLNGIQKITAGQTRLVITHKLAEAQMADKIFVLEKGAVIAEGTHSQLLKNCDLYQTLWNEQNKKTVATNPHIENEETPKSTKYKR